MINLYVVESPFQALCALEASLRNYDEENHIVYRLSCLGIRKTNDAYIENIVSLGIWSSALKLEGSKNGFVLFRLMDGLIFSRRVSQIFRNRINKLYIGEFRAGWMHLLRLNIRPQECWLLDDGSETINVVEKYFYSGSYIPDSLFFDFKIKNIVYFVLYFGLGRRLSKRLSGQLNLFSIFKFDEKALGLSGVKYINHSFETFQERFNGNGREQDLGDEAFFYGSKLSESGLLSRDYELFVLRFIKKYYDSMLVKVKYMPHRDESPEKLRLVNDIFGGNVVYDPGMAELALLKCKNKPVEIASCYSTVLSSLHVLCPDIRRRAFVLDYAEISSGFRSDVASCYQYMKEEGVLMQSVF